ncbi:hypothetical protein BV22DRAFT_119849 [Leucogyrophana mollusca]|uniref:Uncharacterized protein n=1 Tax=Leucogyrophana mollusca TaxID=85980 RepID=A0ACB8BW79_9AGAM|nr:hypothetical protein BV22DRAFT_119849 [Leucogyrophana mollusca]
MRRRARRLGLEGVCAALLNLTLWPKSTSCYHFAVSASGLYAEAPRTMDVNMLQEKRVSSNQRGPPGYRCANSNASATRDLMSPSLTASNQLTPLT